ncbi:serine/threonine-protein kinase [uncultured Agrococcus sp.]|uniref:serine/threonine-protein kinase n=1 Tax=uncultured Agrococcus sp. TaxID=382258 RepID=UPI0025E81C19|nr:serine/threonine-protein kinase [uncultured Agrococcus sp.]
MAQRLPSQPPDLPGFELLHILGRGGFADVFLYEQALPKRHVAVKVVLADLVSDRERRLFRNEVDVMGRLSAHPNIVTVYSASVSDDGRPYLVMELCSTDIGQRYRDEAYSPAEVLDIAIQIASALVAVHKTGMLHRDIKPGNIMSSAYGVPVLSDFGIASGHDHDDAPLTGVSVPWTAPEVLDEESNGSVAADIFSFGATLFSLLAGRSPAELEHGTNKPEDLSERIRSGVLQRLPKSVPSELADTIDRALRHRPESRFESMDQMLLRLQEVQRQLGYASTPIAELTDTWVPSLASESDGATALPLRKRRSRRSAASPIVRSQLDVSSSSRPARTHVRKRRRVFWGMLAASLSFATLAGLTVFALWLSQVAAAIPTVDEVRAQPTQGGVVFEWTDPGLVDSDSFLIRTSGGDAVIQRGTEYVMNGDPGDRLCVTVLVNRDGATGESAEACGEAQ